MAEAVAARYESRTLDGVFRRAEGAVVLAKKPFLRVTKWLGEIPVEAACTLCGGVSFRAQSASHRPVREEYQKSLQSQFDEHCRLVHPDPK